MGKEKPLKQVPGGQISIKIDTADWEALRLLAEKAERPIAVELRRAIRLYLREEETPA